jgi:molecular chaperone HscB
MNYFELFDIPPSLRVGTAELKKKYLALSRQFHPDFHTHSDPAIQQEALENSALLNKAWKTFQDKDATIKYVLQLEGLLEEEEKYELPPAFLMEMLELNEALAETETGIVQKLDDTEAEIYAPVKEVIESGPGLPGKPALLEVKEYYYKKKYLDRIREQLKSSS